MEEIVKYLETLPTMLLHSIVYDLMVKGKLSYHELMDMHIKNLERMRRGETEAYFKLQAEVTKLAYGCKKDRSSNIKDILQLLYDEGRLNTTQEKIDKYK